MRRAERGGEPEAEHRRGYKGVRRRRWGKWVSEIRVPGTRDRLWLGSYATPEAAAVAHDTAVYLLRGGASGAVAAGASGGDVAALNFPQRAAAAYGPGAAAARLSPRSVQRVASDAGMAADAQLVAARDRAPAPATEPSQSHADRAGIGVSIAHGGGGASMSRAHASSSSTGGSREQQLVSGEISVDDIEILM
ncbi:hypothetical protein HU200_054960 [Digitaria exilis]|uniref:AP2/ERF domain-containing protein n=1 Tax=Digitaria exilis TaxID=1010633 RepID=A0A835AJY3_9POAL|nr:hypothetical protein HU200_054960 [Digitaria exilis]